MPISVEGFCEDGFFISTLCLRYLKHPYSILKSLKVRDDFRSDPRNYPHEFFKFVRISEDSTKFPHVILYIFVDL
jgi:hypothetical protein